MEVVTAREVLELEHLRNLFRKTNAWLAGHDDEIVMRRTGEVVAVEVRRAGATVHATDAEIVEAALGCTLGEAMDHEYRERAAGR